MFENLGHFFKKIVKEPQKELGSKDAAKERLHLVLMQDRANVSADFLELMKQEIIDVIKKYIVVDEDSIDVRLTNQTKEDGTNGAPSLYANIPIVNIKNDMMAEKIKDFEGVDFNKEMGIPTYSEDMVEEKTEELHEEEETPMVIELPANNDKIETLPENNEEELQNENNAKETEEQEIAEEMFEEIDDAEDDDDVTFDDLLKAAEAAEKMAEEQLDEVKEPDKNENKEEQTVDEENKENEAEGTDIEKEENTEVETEVDKEEVKNNNKKRNSKKNNNGKRKKK